MICGNCGKENGDNAKFCSGCGTPLRSAPINPSVPANQATMQNNVKKKSNTGLIIGIVLVFVFLMLCAVAGLGWFAYQHFFNAVKTEKTVDDDDDENEDVMEEDDSQEADVEEVEELDTVSILEEYFGNTIENEDGVIDNLNEYKGIYRNLGQDAYSGIEQYLEPIEGVFSHVIYDFDQDEQEELLVVEVQNNQIIYYMYEVEDDEVTLYDIRSSYGGSIGTVDKMNWNLYLADKGEMTYLVENGVGYSYIVADGASYFLSILHYDGTSFIEDLSRDMCGSEFSDTEATVQEVSDDVAELGFTSTAFELDYTYTFQADEEGASLIANMVGFNSQFDNPYYDTSIYYETQDPTLLGTVDYYFYDGEQSFQESNAVNYYEFEKDDYSKTTDNGRTINAYFEYPIFSGENSDAEKWINSQMKLWADDYKNNIFSDEELKNLQENYYDEDWDYMPYKRRLWLPCVRWLSL